MGHRAPALRPAPLRWLVSACLAALLAGGLLRGPREPRLEAAVGSDVPLRLSETGLYADLATRTVAAGNLPYAPQYPLWTDGARKRRWIFLPPGAAIDARDPDHWEFPVGTKLWKEFAFERPVETRLMERLADGRWRYATYRWTEDGADALLVPAGGQARAAESAPGVFHDIPAEADCRACHDAGAAQVLGFSALQLSPDRDPLAPHAETPPAGAVDLVELARRGLLRDLDPALLETAPRVPAATPRARAALGYLHGNCASCHNPRSAIEGLDLSLVVHVGAGERARADALRTAVGRESRFGRRQGVVSAPLRIAPGDPSASVLLRRLGSRNPLVQMPPFGSHAVDPVARDLVEAWIREDLEGAGAEALGDR
jgi:hypothetical protein